MKYHSDVNTFRCHVFSGTNYYMAPDGHHGGDDGTDYSCPAGMTDVGADCADISGHAPSCSHSEMDMDHN